MEKGKFGCRRTTDKPVAEMEMFERALNNCCVVDNNTVYRDYDGVYDIRKLIKVIAAKLGVNIAKTDPEEIDFLLFDYLSYDITTPKGIVAMIYELMWSKAELYEQLKKYENAEEQETAEHEATIQHWISVTERLPKPEEKVLVFCRTSNGYRYQCCAIYIPNGTLSRESGYSWDGEACGEYSEEHDDYYIREGWYERIYNFEDYSCVPIADFVTQWMPLPEAPEVE